MRAHSYDLRAEVKRDFDIDDDAAADLLVHHLASDWRRARLSVPDQALCAYAEKLTLSPAEVDSADIDALRAHGFDDRAIHDATQIVGYFNYINRLADALGVEPEPFIRPWEKAPDPLDSHTPTI